ncbi:MAG: heavy metal-binding domain-containing protein [Dokdonella sp.]
MNAFDRHFVTTSDEIVGYRVTRRPGRVMGNIGAVPQTLAGGDISLFAELCERARSDAFAPMIQHAAQVGANAIRGMRHDANEIAQGVTEVLAYGAAVVFESVRLGAMSAHPAHTSRRTLRSARSTTRTSARAGSSRNAWRLRRS